MKRSSESGFTLVEVLISSAILLPILFAIVTTQGVVGRTISSNERRADTSDQLRKVARRLRQLVRPALTSSVQIKAIQADIDRYTAAEATRQTTDPLGPPILIPAMGQWISPETLAPRETLRFVCAEGTLSVNAAALTSFRTLEFRMDANETDNDMDDDGDGIVDEGKIYLQYDSNSFVLADNIESCSFLMDEGGIVLALQAARRDSTGRIHRASLQQTIHLRNK